MTKLIQTRCGLNLAEAKRCTDQVLEGGECVLSVADAETAQALAQELEELGASVKLQTGDEFPTSGPRAFQI